jgi:uncharacterized membrane protein
MEMLSHALLWFSAVSVGLMAGVYFTFSGFVMRSLNAIDPSAGMLAMQSINREIVKSTFLPIFFLSTLACVILVVIALLDLSKPGATWALSGSLIYIVGMFVVTLVCNVPLNNELEATPAKGSEANSMWKRYLKTWTIWNHVRTASCLASTILLILSISARA